MSPVRATTPFMRARLWISGVVATVSVATAGVAFAAPPAEPPPVEPPAAAAPPAVEPPAAAPPVQPPGDLRPAPPKTIEGNQPGGYDIKLRELEERVVDLKEKVFKSKTRLMLLREQLLHNAIAEAGAVLVHVNEMGSAFTLEQVLYTLDGERVFFQDNHDGKLDSNRSFQVFNGIVSPGDHMVGVELTFRGNGSLFSYIDGYQFKVRSTYTFASEKGRIARIKVIGYERGGMTTDLQQKPYVRYDVQLFKYSRENQRKADQGNLDASGEPAEDRPAD